MIFLSHTEIMRTGGAFVSHFLVLSGFCSTYAYFDKSRFSERVGVRENFRYMLGKARKLYPLHIVTLLAVAAVEFFLLARKGLPTPETPQTVFYFVMNALLLHSWIPASEGYFSFNAVSWYLSVTIVCYFVFPWLLRFVKNSTARRVGIALACVIAAMALVSVALGVGMDRLGWSGAAVKWITYICPLFRLGNYSIGVFLGYFFLALGEKRKTLNKRAVTALQVLMVLLLAFKIYYLNVHDVPKNISYNLLWIPESTLIVFLFAIGGGLSGLLTKCRPLMWIGEISGDAFLIHQIVIKGLEYFTSSKLLLIFAGFAITLGLTILWKKLSPKIFPALRQ